MASVMSLRPLSSASAASVQLGVALPRKSQFRMVMASVMLRRPLSSASPRRKVPSGAPPVTMISTSAVEVLSWKL